MAKSSAKAIKGRVLSVASECVPLLKTGGLADVVGALPGALAQAGWDMRVLMPAYASLRPSIAEAPVLWSSPDLFGGPAHVAAGQGGVLLLDAPHLYDRAGGPYSGPAGDWPDNARRFAALSWAAAGVARDGLADGWKADVVHAHDWQAGLTSAYLAYGGGTPVPSVMTVHNIAFQGWAPATALADLRLPVEQFHADALEYYGGLSSLKAGLVTADRITTVSPRYATELMRPEFGMGLEGVIANRAADVSGILNGVDTDVWSPEASDTPYTSRSFKGKAAARAALCAEFGLDVPGPLAILVSRLTDQKGIDLIPAAMPDFIAAGGGLLVLGSGDPALESVMQDLANRNPGRMAVKIGYDEGLSRRMFAGGDAVLVPSRFEPCGLTQMYGLRFGTLPLVSNVGGLADTVIPVTPATVTANAATGFIFHPTDAQAFALEMVHMARMFGDKKQWQAMMRRAMQHPVGWETSAAAYAALYEGLMA
jgi:starch synthase